MTAPEGYQWRRDKDGLGVWEHRGKVAVEHRGKVAVAGVGHSPVDRRWDGVAMDARRLGNSGFLRRRQPISLATELLLDGSLPSQGPGKEKNPLFRARRCNSSESTSRSL